LEEGVTMMKRVTAACALIGVAAAGGALAAEQTPSPIVDRPMTKQEARFRALDENNDMKLSPQEFQADATSPTEFTKLDTDADGYLSLSEFTARPIPPEKKPADSK
jgi:hypothetical protein